MEAPCVLTVIAQEGDRLCLSSVGDVGAVSAVYEDLVVCVGPALHLLAHSPHVRVLGVQEPLPRPGLARLVGKVSVIDPGQPGEEHHAPVPEHLVEEHLARVVVSPDLDGLQLAHLGEAGYQSL